MEDALNIGQGKIRIFAGRYRKGYGMDAQGFAHHFIDLADARVIFWALLWGEQGFSHKEYKGTPPQNRSGAVSRVLSIAVKGDNVYIELKTGSGKLTPTGAITPNGRADVEVNVTFKLHEARRMAASVLAYLRARDVLRIFAHKQMVSKPTPYTTSLSTDLLAATSALRATTSVENKGTPPMPIKPKNGTAEANSIGKSQASRVNGRPVTRKDIVKANGAATTPANGNPAAPQPLQYGNGSLVDGKNITEVQTFQRYKAEKQAAPTSKADLLDFYQQRTPAVAG
ncbi:MAG: hypothetical protein M5U34_36970 [Chloroflexi bacterium]|nr:hypothetical protein [Chloroflexota bacterium]